MSVTAFRLKNFMAFEDSEWVELRKINLLYGRNSCGKSVLIRALRLLSQSLKAAASGEPITFVDEGGADVGSFKAALHRSPQDKPIKFYKAFDNASSWSRVISFGFRCEIQLAAVQHRKELEWVVLKDLLSAPPEGTISFEVNLIFSLGGERVVGVGFDLRRCETIDQKTQWLTLQFDPDIEPNWSGYSITHFPSKSSDVLASYFAIDYSNGFLPSLELNEDDFSYITDFERKLSPKIVEAFELAARQLANLV